MGPPDAFLNIFSQFIYLELLPNKSFAPTEMNLGNPLDTVLMELAPRLADVASLGRDDFGAQPVVQSPCVRLGSLAPEIIAARWRKYAAGLVRSLALLSPRRLPFKVEINVEASQMLMFTRPPGVRFGRSGDCSLAAIGN